MQKGPKSSHCRDEEEGLLLMHEWLKVIERDAGHSLSDVKIEYERFTEHGPYDDMDHAAWFKTTDPKIKFIATYNLSDAAIRSHIPESWETDFEKYSASLDPSSEEPRYVRKVQK